MIFVFLNKNICHSQLNIQNKIINKYWTFISITQNFILNNWTGQNHKVTPPPGPHIMKIKSVFSSRKCHNHVILLHVLRYVKLFCSFWLDGQIWLITICYVTIPFKYILSLLVNHVIYESLRSCFMAEIPAIVLFTDVSERFFWQCIYCISSYQNKI